MNSRIIDQGFEPAWWLPEGHSQTLWRKFRPAEKVAQRRQVVELPDGDFINLDWAGPIPAQVSDKYPIILILHGLCGCSRSSYVLTLQASLQDSGIPSVAVNFRGCGGQVNRLARAYHSGVSDDVNCVYQQLAAQFPHKRFAAVGYSLGANVLLKWLGEQGRAAKLSAAVAVSSPFDLSSCSKSMSRGLPAGYGRYFLKSLMADLAIKKNAFKELGLHKELDKLMGLEGLDEVASLWDFDDKVTGPLHGFANASDYYKQCSSINFIKDNAVRTLLVQAEDDPIIPRSAIPQQAILPANTMLKSYRKGGHVGFIGKRGNWLEQLIECFINRPEYLSS